MHGLGLLSFFRFLPLVLPSCRLVSSEHVAMMRTMPFDSCLTFLCTVLSTILIRLLLHHGHPDGQRLLDATGPSLDGPSLDGPSLDDGSLDDGNGPFDDDGSLDDDGRECTIGPPAPPGSIWIICRQRNARVRPPTRPRRGRH